ncbi:MAG: hypothetical protein WCG27_05585, partial [Pseudomonadota bacterium]
MNNGRPSQIFFFILFMLFLYFLFWPIFHAYFGPLIFGAILASALSPLQRLLRKKFPKMSSSWSSAILCAAALFMVVLPLVYVLARLSQEVMGLYQTVQDALGEQSMQDFLFGNGVVASFIKKGIKLLRLSSDPVILQGQVMG